MAFSSPSIKQRLRIGVVAWAILIPVILALNDVLKVYSLAKSGETISGTITRRYENPTDSRAYSTFSYTSHGTDREGIAPGVTGYVVGQQITVTVDKTDPNQYWVGNASDRLWRVIIESIVGALWLSVGIAILIRWPWAPSE